MKLSLFVLCLSVVFTLGLSLPHKTQKTADDRVGLPNANHDLTKLSGDEQRVLALEQQLARIRQGITGIGKNLRAMKIAKNHMEKIPEDHASANISFSAYLGGSGILVDVAEGETVPFDNVLYRSDESFNEVTYIFTCSETGVHFFAAAVGVFGCTLGADVVCRVALIRNDQVIAGGAVDESADYTLLTMSALTDCARGDQVFVRVRGGTVKVEGSDEGRETRFSGLFVHSTEDI